MPNQKRTSNQSKEEIESNMKRVDEVKRLRSKVKDVLYPAVVDASASIDDAKMMLHSFSNIIMETFLARMKETNFLELKLHEKLDKKSPHYKKYMDILAIFGDENAFTAKELIEGLKMEIEMNINNEMKERPLASLKTNFL